MVALSEELARERARWWILLGNRDPYLGPDLVGLGAVLDAHFVLVEYFRKDGEPIGGVGPKNPDLLHSALFRQHAGFGSIRKWSDPFDLCATAFFGLIMNHPFHDCNKRTAFLAALHQLHRLRRIPRVPHSEFEGLAVSVADRSICRSRVFQELNKRGDPDAEVRTISRFLRTKTRQTDSRYYTVTYRQLDSILRRFGFSLADPSGNYVKVVRDSVEESTSWFRRKRGPVRQVLAEIGFPGWSSQVGQGAIRTVRNATGLVPEKGVDSQIFFHGADELESLVGHYEGPLRRLGDR